MSAGTASLGVIHYPNESGHVPVSCSVHNLDFLFWRAKEFGASKEQLESMPWILWYIWKSRNDKTFYGKETPALDIVSLASSECSSWKVAHVLENLVDMDDVDIHEIPQQRRLSPSSENNLVVSCKFDASWRDKDSYSGLGFLIHDSPPSLLGLIVPYPHYMHSWKHWHGQWRRRSKGAICTSVSKLIAWRF